MSRRLFPLAFVMVLALQAGGLPAQSSTAEIAARANPATVTILALTASGDTLGQGSGFVVSADGTVVTNWHVIESAADVEVKLSSGERYDRVQYLDALPEADVALIQIPGFGLDHLGGTSDLPSAGDQVVVIGSPLGLSNSVSDGIVSAVRLLNGRQILQITAPISPGSSGGPVLDTKGRVVGIATAYLPEGQGLNFAIPVKYALGLLNLNPAPKPFPGSGGSVRGAPGASVPATASTVRSDLTGVYSGYLNESQWWIAMIYPRPRPPADRLMVVAGDTTGILFTMHGRVLATRDGRVAITIPFDERDWAFEGYQTSEGLFLEARYFGQAGSSGLHLTPHEIPLSSWVGLYRVSCRTAYRSGGYYGGMTDWEGFGVLGPKQEEGAFLNFLVENEDGGTTGLGTHFDRPAGKTVRLNSRDRMISIVGGWPPSGGIWEHDFTDRRDGGARFEGSCDWRKW